MTDDEIANAPLLTAGQAAAVCAMLLALQAQRGKYFSIVLPYEREKNYRVAVYEFQPCGPYPVGVRLALSNTMGLQYALPGWIRDFRTAEHFAEAHGAAPAQPALLPEGYIGSTLFSNPNGSANLNMYFSSAAQADQYQAALASAR
ncbi:MAG: hypothetical protein JWR74_2147 [Polaromonas sp.]|nr:hypothetical protein [Polaromonas sp.]